MSVNGEWMSSDGHYPYTLRYGSAEGDLSSREKRKNTDVQTFRAEAGLYGNFSDKEQWRLKAYYFQSSRGLSTTTILPNTCGIKTLSYKVNTRKNSANNGYSKPLPSGIGAINVT